MSQQQRINDDLEDEDDDDQEQQQRRENADIKQLRKQARRATQLEAEIAEMRRERALEKAGLQTPDGKDLSERQLKALLATHEGDMTAEALRATAVELGFAAPAAEQQQQADDFAAQQRVTTAAAGGTSAPTGVITPADAEQWSTERLLRFRQQFPQQFEALKRGEEVVGVAF